MTVLRALAFIVCYGAWLWLLARINSPERLAKKPLRVTALNGAILSVSLCIFAGLHCGSFDPKVALGLFLIGQSSILFTLVIGAFLDIKQDVISACLRWGAFQIGRDRLARFLVLWMPFSALIGYPIVVVYGIFYPHATPTIYAVRSVIALIFWMIIPVTFWVLWGVLSTRYWREDIRSQMLLMISSGALNTILYFVVFLWAFNLSGAGATLTFLGTRVLYSPRIVGYVFLGLMILYLIPYLRGIYLGRHALKKFHRARRDFLNRIIRVLKYPEIGDAEGALGLLRNELNEGIKAFQASDSAFKQVEILADETLKPEDLKYDRQAFAIARDHDVRFENLDWFSTLETLLESARQSISQKQSADAKKEVMAQWSVFFEQYRAELTDHIEASPKASALIILGVLASATIGTVFSKAGEGLWELLKESLK